MRFFDKFVFEIFVFVLLVPLNSKARYTTKAEKYFHITGMLGNVLTPYSGRIGFSAVELGMLTYEQLGFVYVLALDGDKIASIGPAWSLEDNTVGVYGSIGVEFFPERWDISPSSPTL